MKWDYCMYVFICVALGLAAGFAINMAITFSCRNYVWIAVAEIVAIVLNISREVARGQKDTDNTK